MAGPYTPMALAIETDRLSLRLRVKEDAAWNLELLGEREGGTALTVAEAEQRLVEQHAEALDTGIGFLALERRAEGDVIGYCGLLIGRTTVHEPEIGYELFRRAHGQGYATEAARAVLDAAFATGRQRIWATVRPWNTPSFRVLEKIGFRRHHSVTDDRGDLVYLVREA